METSEGKALYVELPFNPVPAARPRVGRYGTFYPKAYNEYRTTAHETLIKWKRKKLVAGPVTVVCEFVVKKPKKPSNTYPSKGDIDNYVKALLDACTKAQVFWKDDMQIIDLKATKRYCNEGEDPCTTMTVYCVP
jgi:Holliday junction resolvase RusA-like endonuclease